MSTTIISMVPHTKNLGIIICRKPCIEKAANKAAKVNTALSRLIDHTLGLLYSAEILGTGSLKEGVPKLHNYAVLREKHSLARYRTGDRMRPTENMGHPRETRKRPC